MTHKKICRILNPVMVIAITLLSITSFMGCSFTNHAIAALRSTDHFVSSDFDSRVLYEPGAEEYAEKIASLFSAAVQQVEEGQFRPFQGPIRVYVSGSRESHRKYYGSDARAGVMNGKIFLSPRIFEHGDEAAEKYLMHELSHMHLFQPLGNYKWSRIPSWFHEGLATYVSDGGGANLVSQEQAIQHIQSGRHFILHKTRGLIFKKKRSEFNLHHHMFYRQSMMFVGYLITMDNLKFRKLLLAVEDGESFSTSVHEAYNKSLNELWLEFLGKIKEKG